MFVGDVLSCYIKAIRENLIPEGKTVEDVLNGSIEEEEEEEEEVKEEVKEEGNKNIMTSEEFQQMLDEQTTKPTIVFTDGIVFSNNKYWIITLSYL